MSTGDSMRAWMVVLPALGLAACASGGETQDTGTGDTEPDPDVWDAIDGELVDAPWDTLVDTGIDTPVDSGGEDVSDVGEPEPDLVEEEPMGCAALTDFDLVTDSDGNTVPDDTPLLITEIMVNPVAVLDTSGEYVEVQNVSGREICSLRDLIISDDDYSASIGADLALPAGGFLLFGLTATAGENYGVPTGVTPSFVYFQANFSLRNGTAGDHAAISYGTTTIHQVDYRTGASDTGLTWIGNAAIVGQSFYLNQEYVDGVPGADPVWCDTPRHTSYAYNTLGSITDYGTPGEVNPDCP